LQNSDGITGALGYDEDRTIRPTMEPQYKELVSDLSNCEICS